MAAILIPEAVMNIVITGCASHIGGRPEQQDRVHVIQSVDERCCLLVLADGMGGHSGGALAAQTVIDCACACFTAGVAAGIPLDALLRRMGEETHAQVNAVGRQHHLSPRSTGVFLLLGQTEAHWLHVGDSRLYFFRRGRLKKQTKDHSVVQILVDSGALRPEAAAHHRDQGRLLASLGGDSVPHLDLDRVQFRAGDGFLLCSDGLWESISPQEMSAALFGTPTLDVAAQQLVTLAVQRGGAAGDNVAVAMARVEEDTHDHRWIRMIKRMLRHGTP